MGPRAGAAYHPAMVQATLNAAERIGSLAHVEPDLLIGHDAVPYGAIWSHAPVTAEVQGLEQHALVLHLAGSTLVEKWVDGRHAPAPPLKLGLTAATLKRLFAHVDGHLAEPLRLAELAAIARLSEDHFLRAFKAAVGQTPHQYVLQRRIAHAQRLLATSAMPVVDVARIGGFRGASHFAAAFRQRVGMTPSAWRKSRH